MLRPLAGRAPSLLPAPARPCARPPRRSHPRPPRASPLQDRADALSPATARLYLCLVPLCWGTYNPALRFLYSQPHPPSPGELSATRLLLALLPFLPALLDLLRRAREQPAGPAGGEATDWRGVLAASLELGAYNLGGTSLQAFGLAHTSAVHAGVLLSSINVLVPLGAALTGEPVRPATWLACLLVLTGVAVLNSDTGVVALLASGGEALRLELSGGDVAVLGASLCYATYTVRLAGYARRLPALPLSAGKTACLAAGCLAWAAAEATLRHRGGLLAGGSVLWGGAGEAAPVVATAWATVGLSALLPGSAATWLQARGLSGVRAAEAQLILALSPLVSILLAAALLGEPVGETVWEGGALMLSASLLCVASDAWHARQVAAASE